MCDERYGEAAQSIAPGTPFGELAYYRCPTCEAPPELLASARWPASK
ncbi:rubredoxin [Hymenobacter sp. BRD67]|nr:rubredoxin [Hymenobacter sp. BRD67]